MKKYKKISSRKILSNKHIQLYLDKVKLASGRVYNYYLTNKNNKSVFILPVDKGGRVLILREYRYPVGKAQ